MKSKKKEVELDLSSLPPCTSLYALLLYTCNKSQADLIRNTLSGQSNRSIIKVLNLNAITQTAKDKGLYLDPATLTDKQRKDKTLADIPTTLTPEILCNAFLSTLEDLDIQIRRAKKEKFDQETAAKEKAAQPTKGAGKNLLSNPVKKPDEESSFMKELPRSCDIFYLLHDYPATQQDFELLRQKGFQLDMVYTIGLKFQSPRPIEFQNILGPNIGEDLHARIMEEFYEDDEEIQQKRQEDFEALINTTHNQSPLDKEFILQNHTTLNYFLEFRKCSDRKSAVRNTVCRELSFDYNPLDEATSAKAFLDLIIEDLSIFSLDQREYNEWVKDRKVAPFAGYRKTVGGDQDDQLVILQKKAALIGGSFTMANLVGGSRGQLGQQQNTHGSLKSLASPTQAEKRTIPFEATLRQYNRNLKKIPESEISPGIILESLIDQIALNRNPRRNFGVDNPLKESVPLDINSLFDVDDWDTSIFPEEDKKKETLQGNGESSSRSEQQSLVPPSSSRTPINFHLLDYSNQARQQAPSAKFATSELIADRQNQTLKYLKTPGLNRNSLPEAPTKSRMLREFERCQISPFISTGFSDFLRQMVLRKMEVTARGLDSKRNWDFSDRIYGERLDADSTRFRIAHGIFFTEAELITSYDESDDSALVILGHRNPPGRMLGRHWISEWNVLPNFENWLHFFKTNERNLQKNIFFDVDYQSAGKMNQRLKVFTPRDNSIILSKKQLINESCQKFVRVYTETLSFGISYGQQVENAPETNLAEIWAYATENKTSYVVSLDKTITKASASNAHNKGRQTLTCSLSTGLVIRCGWNGNVVMTKLEADIAISNLPGIFKQFGFISKDEIAPTVSSVNGKESREINRVLTGKGTVIRYLEDGTIELMHANGNSAIKMPGETLWMKTNNRGLRSQKNIATGEIIRLEHEPAASQTDRDTGSIVTIRNDGTQIVKYKDGRVYTLHRDGTKIFSAANGKDFLVEHPIYPPVQIKYNVLKSRTVTVNLPDNSTLGCFEQGAGGKYTYKVRTLEGCEIRVEEVGRFEIIPDVNAPAKRTMYSGDLEEGIMWTEDEEGNRFTLFPSGEVEVKASNPEESKISAPQPQTEPLMSADRQGNDQTLATEVAPLLKRAGSLPVPEGGFPPRLFKVYNEERAAIELLNEAQLSRFFHKVQTDEVNNFLLKGSINTEILGSTDQMTYITKIQLPCDQKKTIIKASIPKSIDFAFEKPEERQTIDKDKNQNPGIFTMRNLVKFDIVDQTKKDETTRNLEHFEAWKQRMIRESLVEFPYVPKTEEEKQFELQRWNFYINTRRKPPQYENYSTVKNFVLGMIENGIIPLEQLGAKSRKPSEEAHNRGMSQWVSMMVTTKAILGELENISASRQSAHIDRVVTQKIKTLADFEAFEAQIQQCATEVLGKASDMDILTLPEEEYLSTQKTAISVEKMRFFVTNFSLTCAGYLFGKTLPPEARMDKDQAEKYKKRYLKPSDFIKNLDPEGLTTKSLNGLRHLPVTAEGSNESSKFRFPIQRKLKLDHNTRTPPEPNGGERALTTEDGFRDAPLTDREYPKPKMDLSPIITLEPKRNRSKFERVVGMQVQSSADRPSYFALLDKQQQLKDQNDLVKILKAKQLRKKELTVTGDLRDPAEYYVSVMTRTTPNSEINRHYISVESQSERRVKIASMSKKMSINAPTIASVRKEAPHTIMTQTIDKKFSLEAMDSRRNAMIQAELYDNTTRDVIITPSSVHFGPLRRGRMFESVIVVKNEDPIAQRLLIKKPKSPAVTVTAKTGGAIPLGLNRELYIQIDTTQLPEGGFVDSFQIGTKHNIYTVPIQASIMGPWDFDKAHQIMEGGLSRTAIRSNVREVSPRGFIPWPDPEPRKSTPILPAIPKAVVSSQSTNQNIEISEKSP